MKNIHRKTKHIVNYGFCCTFILVFHILRRGGREEGGSGRPSQVCGQAGWDKHEEKTTRNRKKTERAAIITTTLLLFNFVYPLSPHTFGESPGFELFCNYL